MVRGGTTDVWLSFFCLKPYKCLARKTKVTLQLGYVLDSRNDDSTVGWVIPRKHTLNEC